jgi:hypothetical protein
VGSLNQQLLGGKMKRLLFAAFVVVVPLGLVAGCASGPTTYSLVSDLRDAYESAGFDCPEWDQSNQVTAASESGTCDSSTVLMVFDDEASATSQAKSLASLVRSFGSTPSIAYGANWVVNTDQAEIVAKELHGSLISK